MYLFFSSRGTNKLFPCGSICGMAISAWDTGHWEFQWDRDLEMPLAGLSREKYHISFKQQYIQESQKSNPASRNLLKFRQIVV